MFLGEAVGMVGSCLRRNDGRGAGMTVGGAGATEVWMRHLDSPWKGREMDWRAATREEAPNSANRPYPPKSSSSLRSQPELSGMAGK